MPYIFVIKSYVAILYLRHCLMEIRNNIITGNTIPISLGIVLWFDNSPSINKSAQISKDAKIAAKLKSEVFKNLALIGTKKNIIITKHGTKNG